MSQARAVLIGASNIYRTLPLGLAAARQILGQERDLEMLVAAGRGRSYGQWSTLLGRTMPGILECGIWRALENGQESETYTLIADIGNDIGYGVQPAVLVGWVEECVRRLQPLGEKHVLVLPPARAILARPSWQLDTARRLLFPSHAIDAAAIKDRVREMDERLRDMVSRYDVTVIEQLDDWYGIDPIHIRPGCWSESWNAWMAPWNESADTSVRSKASTSEWVRTMTGRPERWAFLGIPQKGRDAVLAGARICFY